EDCPVSPCRRHSPVQAGTDTCQIPVPTLPLPRACSVLNPDTIQTGPAAGFGVSASSPTAPTQHAHQSYPANRSMQLQPDQMPEGVLEIEGVAQRSFS